MPIRSTTRSLAFCVAALMAATPALATQDNPRPAGIIKDNGGSERIDYAGKLRMLSQRIPASACNAAAGIGGWEALGYLQASMGEYDRIMNALEFGDVFILIRTPERDRRVLARIDEMNTVWHPVRDEMRAMIENEKADALTAVSYATEAAPKLLDITQALVGDLIGEYADPTVLLAADAVSLDIVSRQRMLPQIISKSACMLAEDIYATEAREELRGAIDLYELALGALRNGMPEAGVTPPPTEEIAADLAEIAARWQSVRPLLERLESDGTLSREERETVYSEMNNLTAAMNEVSARYAKASKIAL